MIILKITTCFLLVIGKYVMRTILQAIHMFVDVGLNVNINSSDQTCDGSTLYGCSPNTNVWMAGYVGVKLIKCWAQSGMTCEELREDADTTTEMKMNYVDLSESNITELTENSIPGDLQKVEDLALVNVPFLRSISITLLKKMPNLVSLYISAAPKLEKLPALPPLPSLRIFRVINSGLTEIPNLARVHERNPDSLFHLVDLENNHIRSIPTHALRIRAAQLNLDYNIIESIPPHAFKNAEISKLSLKGNAKLNVIDSNAFHGIKVLRELDLSGTSITRLPSLGLEKLEYLYIEQTPTLKVIPSAYDFEALKEAHLTHHFHCCAFAFPERHDKSKHELNERRAAIAKLKCLQGVTENIENATVGTSTSRMKRHIKRNATSLPWTSYYDTEEYRQSNESNEDYEYNDSKDYLNDNDALGEFHEEEIPPSAHYDCSASKRTPKDVVCTPKPDALNPCEDVMGWTWLRTCVWAVLSLAVFGNLAVLVVLLARRHLTAPQLLMAHLAAADFFTGLYLFMLAAVDLKSFGEYFNYAFDWQYGTGCKIAGFLSVFSGQLSVYALAAVTLERWFAITYAIYLERRVCVSTAAKIMVGGWIFAAFLAALPLFGVSSYSSTSICLPVASDNIAESIYQGALFATNAIAWGMIVTCYIKIYRSIGGAGSQPGGAAASERRVAKKMALLVLTDLLCWAPVAFFGCTALAGAPLIDVSHSKVLLVFFYPLNACANPFLYAILTEQYRRDASRLLRKVTAFSRCGILDRNRKGHCHCGTDMTAPTPLLVSKGQHPVAESLL